MPDPRSRGHVHNVNIDHRNKRATGYPCRRHGRVRRGHFVWLTHGERDVTDLAHQFGSDLVVGPTGDLATLDVPAVTVQRLLRRLLTNPGDYIWHPDYGAGLPRFVGQTINARVIEGVVRGQIFQESGVARVPEPTIRVTANVDGTVSLQIQYTDAAVKKPSVLSFDVTAQGAANITTG